MHELSIVEDIIQILEKNAKEQNFSKVQKIRLEIGALSCVDVDALKFCFSAVSNDSVADGAKLEIIEIPGTGFCINCKKTIAYKALYEPCPYCNNYNIQKIAGDEMRVKDLEVL